MSSWTTQDRITGRERQLEKLAMDVPPLVRVVVGARSTSGSVHRKKGGDADVSRSAGDNVMVLRAQAKQGRDIAFLTSTELTAAADLWRAGFRAAWKTPGNATAAIMREAQTLGQFLVMWFQQHIERGIARTGAVRPVTAETAKAKAREVGAGLPPMVRTGQLLRSFVVRVTGG